jgi:hypothetical protein
MKRKAIGLVCLLCIAAASGRAEDFTIRLGLKNAHLREVFFGCAEGATAGYDRNKDDFAPPPGIETGYVGFISGVKNLPLFYKDIHGTEPEQTWRFYTRVYEGKPIEISWDKAALPKGWTLILSSKAGDVDMAKTDTIVLPESETLMINARNKGNTTKKDETGANAE